MEHGGTAIMSVTSHLCGEVPFRKGWNIFENGPIQELGLEGILLAVG